MYSMNVYVLNGVTAGCIGHSTIQLAGTSHGDSHLHGCQCVNRPKTPVVIRAYIVITTAIRATLASQWGRGITDDFDSLFYLPTQGRRSGPHQAD